MQNDVRLKVLAAAIGLCLSGGSWAATSHRVQQTLAPTALASLTTQLGLGPNASLAERNRQTTLHGVVVRQQQLYLGVPVYGHTIAVQENASGQALGVSGLVAQGLSVDLASVKPRLTAAQAIGALENAAHTLAANRASISNVEATLYVYVEDGAKARLVYLASYFSAAPQPSRPTALIDADTGAIIQQWDGLTTDFAATGPGGNQKTGRYVYGTNYPALVATQSGSTCSLQNGNVITLNLHGGLSGGSVVSFTCPNSDTDATNGAYSPANDAHHFGGVVHDMYQNWTGAPPLNFRLVMNVHYSSNYENAFWDGTSMNFGDGASTFYPLVSLDVTGHEISHGYTEQNSGLAYTGQSGGMNEAYSDIAGQAAEYYDRGANDFLVGADIMKASTALRFMCNPPQDGGSIDNAANYRSGMDVHYSSGVYNKAFCLLAKTSGWNTKTAFLAFQRANRSY